MNSASAQWGQQMVNMRGEDFAINHPGYFDLLRVPQECTDALEGDACFEAIGEARSADRDGISKLRGMDTADIQEYFWMHGLHECQKPCRGKDPDEETKLRINARLASVSSPCSQRITELKLSGAWMGRWKKLKVRAASFDETGRLQTPFSIKFGSVGKWLTLQDIPKEGILVKESPEGLDGTVKLTAKVTDSDHGHIVGEFVLDVAGAKVGIVQKKQGLQFIDLKLSHLKQFGREDVGGLLGYDRHGKELDLHSEECKAASLADDSKMTKATENAKSIAYWD